MPSTMDDMNQVRRRSASRHSLHLDKRENLVVTGMLEMISFNTEIVTCETEMGIIVIKGANLHVGRINPDNGELVVNGQIDSITYNNQSGEKAKSLLGRLFK